MKFISIDNKKNKFDERILEVEVTCFANVKNPQNAQEINMEERLSTCSIKHTRI